MSTLPPAVKSVLYCSAREALARDFFAAIAEVTGCSSTPHADGSVVTCGARSFRFTVRHGIEAALATIHAQFFDLVLLDLREPVHATDVDHDDFEQGLALLDAMDREADVERRYGFHRIVVLVSGADALEVDVRIATLGTRGVGRVMRDLSTCHLHPGCQYLPPRAEFARRVLEEMTTRTLHREVGKLALCASGGGITGLYYEMGALKCLEDCCGPGALNDFDLYYGISSGSVVCGMLANGYTISEFMAAVAGHRGGRIPPLRLNLLQPAHLDLAGITAPLRQLVTLAWKGACELSRLRFPFSFESLFFEYGDLVHAPFNTSGFAALLERAFTEPGHTNAFGELRRALFIGATDQDRREAILFGEPPHDDVPISLAIQASMSLNPVFAPTLIKGRYYEDGAVTRTSNFVEAIAKGADLVVALDPLVPYVSKEPGFARSRGVVYNADQNIKTVSYTRYETTKNWVLRRHPEVSLYTFLPANQLRRIMWVNPMDHRPYREIWRGAYLSTLRRMHTLEYRMRGDFAFHGIALDTSRADAVAERLQREKEPALEDFFPGGRVQLDPPSCPPRPSPGIAAA